MNLMTINFRFRCLLKIGHFYLTLRHSSLDKMSIKITGTCADKSQNLSLEKQETEISFPTYWTRNKKAFI